jgi:hypothetical protein
VVCLGFSLYGVRGASIRGTVFYFHTH